MLSSNILADIGNEFVNIFIGEFAWVTITLMAIGIVLCLVEAIIPGFGFFGITGIICEVAAVIVHATLCKGTPLQILILILLITLVTLLIFLLFVRSAKHGLLGKTPIVENDTSIPLNYGEKDIQSLRSLIGKEGITLTDCKPIGKMRIGENVYEVSSKSSLIVKGDVVKVVDIEGTTIYISKITY